MALYQVSPVFVRTAAIVGGVSPTYASLPEVSLDIHPTHGFDAIEVSPRRCTELLPKVSPVFVRVKAIVGKVSPTYASLPEVSLEMRPSLELFLGFVAIEVSRWRCTELLPEVSPVFVRAEAIVGKVSRTYASLPEVSLDMHPPVSSLSGLLPSMSLFGAVPNYSRRSLQYSFV